MGIGLNGRTYLQALLQSPNVFGLIRDALRIRPQPVKLILLLLLKHVDEGIARSNITLRSDQLCAQCREFLGFPALGVVGNCALNSALMRACARFSALLRASARAGCAARRTKKVAHLDELLNAIIHRLVIHEILGSKLAWNRDAVEGAALAIGLDGAFGAGDTRIRKSRDNLGYGERVRSLRRRRSGRLRR